MSKPYRSSHLSTVIAADVPTESAWALEWVAYLVAFEGDSTRMVPLPSSGDFIIGRAESADLVLNDQRVSRSHARISVALGRARLHDLGSQNGTLVNGAPFKSPYTLMANDAISVGAATLIFHFSTSHAASVGWLDVSEFRARF
jgi:pSer/pThr/pTyr-binding forkhead associated (FHA) protein